MTTADREVFEGFGYAKALIFGEYAVMYGSPCLVAALDRRVMARLEAGSKTSDEFVERIAASIGMTVTDQHIELENKAFFDREGRKIGIGSSSAAVVAASNVLAAANGRVFGTRQDLMAAIQAHRVLQGGVGSGADVIASLLGGLVLVQNCPDAPEIRRVSPHAVPPFGLIALHEAAPTTNFVNAAHALDQSEEYQAVLRELTNANIELAQLVQNFENRIYHEYLSEFLQKIDDMNDILLKLQNILQKPIQTPRFVELREVGRAYDVVLKTSGAGGGDICLVFAKSKDELERYMSKVESLGIDRLEVEVARERNCPLQQEIMREQVQKIADNAANREGSDQTGVAVHSTLRETEIEPHALALESALARMYVTILVDIVLITIAGAIFVCVGIGWSTFALLQIIGFMLFGMVLGMALLHFRRKRCLEDARTLCEAAHIDFESFRRFVKMNQNDFTLAQDALSHHASTVTAEDKVDKKENP